MSGGLSRWEWSRRGKDQGGIKEGPQGVLRGRGGIIRTGGGPAGIKGSSRDWLEGRMVFCEQRESFMETLKTVKRMCLPASLPPWNVIDSGTLPIPEGRTESVGLEASKSRHTPWGMDCSFAR